MRRLHDLDGVSFADAARRVGFDVSGMGADPARLAGIGTVVELHIEQGRLLQAADPTAIVGIGSEIVAHGRWRITVTGQGNHAGTTRLADRHDPMIPAAAAVLAARREITRHDGAVATVGRIRPIPGGTNVIASTVQLWLDVRHGSVAETARLVDDIVAAVREEAAAEGCTVVVQRDSSSERVTFDPALGLQLSALLDAPVVPTACRPRRRGARRACADRNAVRAQPVRHLARPGRARRRGRLRRRDRRAGGRAGGPAHRQRSGVRTGTAAVTGPSSDGAPVTIFRCAQAIIDGAVRSDIDIHCANGMITQIAPAAPTPPLAPVESLPGVVLPGFADAHSHAFHRALRGRTHDRGGTFWTWRQDMYRLADGLDPDSLRALTLALYVEELCAGYTAVGEFHYLHHGPGGRPYDEPNAMGLAIADAAVDAGIRLTLIDVAYLAGGFAEPVTGTQLRFSDGDADRWAKRVSSLTSSLTSALPSPAPARRDGVVRVGVGVHSVRAVPPRQLPAVAELANDADLVLHAHLSEQAAENDAAVSATGATPTQLLADAGVLGPRTALVHGTHLTDADVEIIGRHHSAVVICPATEADLGDGLPSAPRLSSAGARLALGGDQHVIVDPFAQARGLEYGDRLARGRRGAFSPAALLAAATVGSHDAIFSPGGRLAVGAPADLVAVRTDSARTAGCAPEQLVMAACAADVAVVVVGGAVVARDGAHVRHGDPGPLLAAAISGAWGG